MCVPAVRLSTSLETRDSVSRLSVFLAGRLARVVANATFPTVPEGIAGPSSLRRALTRLRSAALLWLVESLYHSL